MNKTNKKTLVTLLAALIMLFSACFACLPQKSARGGAEEEPSTKNCTDSLYCANSGNGIGCKFFK